MLKEKDQYDKDKEIKIIKPYDYSKLDVRSYEIYKDEKFAVGKEFVNNKGYKFKIIAKSNKRCCRFIEFESGYVSEATTYMIGEGRVRDRLSPYAYGVGICDMVNAKFHPLYDQWLGMIKRCYNKEDKYYKYYGGKGVYVSNEWHKFSNFVRDMEKKENYKEMITSKNKYHIDKDIKSNNKRYYSNDTVSIVKKEDNNKEMNKRNTHIADSKKIKVEQYDLSMKLINVFSSMSEASRITGITTGNISSCCNGKLKTAGGYIWKKKGSL